MDKLKTLQHLCYDPHNLNYGQTNLQDYLIGGKYKVIQRIGYGSFGVIFMGVDKQSLEKVAIKLERRNSKTQQLILEYKIHSMLNTTHGFPRVRYYGTDETYNAMVMDLLGPSLEDCFAYCNRRFSLKTNLMLMDQMIMRIEEVHKQSFIHRDIKPENFLMGTGTSSHRLYLIDFGLAARYRDPTTNLHVPLLPNQGVIGTARYISLNAHKSLQQSRRDDMLSIGYVFMYFNRGELPWQCLPAVNRKQQMERIFDRKMAMTLKQLCHGYPLEFYHYFEHCNNLKFDEEPDYLYMRRLFRILFKNSGFEYDYKYDWHLVSRHLRSDNRRYLEKEEDKFSNMQRNLLQSTRPSQSESFLRRIDVLKI